MIVMRTPEQKEAYERVRSGLLGFGFQTSTHAGPAFGEDASVVVLRAERRDTTSDVRRALYEALIFIRATGEIVERYKIVSEMQFEKHGPPSVVDRARVVLRGYPNGLGKGATP